MQVELFRLSLGLMGLAAFFSILWVTARSLPHTAAAWTRGGAVAIAVAGFFALLLALGKL